MSKIRITARGGGEQTCCFCLDVVGDGPACPACATPYHGECAAIVGRCVILGCRQPLGAARGLSWSPLPRLGILARAMGRWARLGLTDDEADLGSAVVLLPSRREVKESQEAARVVGELLGPEHSVYDGRLRLQSPHPEPLARTDANASALGLVERLRAVGASATAMPMRQLLAPADALEVVEVSSDPVGLTARDAQGREGEVLFGTPRLVVTGAVVDVERKPVTRRQAGFQTGPGGSVRYSPAKTSLYPQDRRQSEPCLHVLRPGETPLFFRRSGMRNFGGSLRLPPGAVLPWYKLTEDLKQGATVIDVPAGGSPALLTPSPGDPSSQSNLQAVHLLARVWSLAWQLDPNVLRPEPRERRSTGFQVKGLRKPG